MELQDTLLKDFASAINKETEDSGNGKTVYAKVSRVVDDTVYIIIDGSTEETPATTMVEVGENDRVFATIKSHSVVVTGNISYPSLTRVGEAYITMIDGGLVVGFLDDENNPYGNRLLIGKANNKTASFSVVDPDGTILASFGTTTTVGAENTTRVKLTGSSISFLDKDGNTLASFGSKVRVGQQSGSNVYIEPTAITIFNNGKNVASFGESVRIGPTSGARVMIGDGLITVYRNSSSKVFEAGLIDVPNPGIAQVDIGTRTKPTVTSASGQSIQGNFVSTGTIWSYKESGGEARVVVGSYGDNYAEGYLVANNNGRFGIYDSLHKKWVINTESDGMNGWIRIGGKNPATLSNTILSAHSMPQNTYAQQTISDLINWNAVIVWATVVDNTVPLLFVRGDTKEAVLNVEIPDTGSNTGGFAVDWAGNHVQVRWKYRVSSYYKIQIEKVYGFIPR